MLETEGYLQSTRGSFGLTVPTIGGCFRERNPGSRGESKAENMFFLILVDTASKFALTYPHASKETEGVARKLLELVLALGVPSLSAATPGRTPLRR